MEPSPKRDWLWYNLIRYYQTFFRDLTATDIQWNQVVSNFVIQWKVLKERKDEDDPEVPKITMAHQSSNGLKLSKTSSTALLGPG